MLTNFRKTLVFSEKILYWSVFWDVVVQLPNYVRLFATPWTEACQASLSFIISWSLLRFMSMESMIPSNNFILCHPPLLLPSVFPSIKVFSNESAVCIRLPKYWSVFVCVCVSRSVVSDSLPPHGLQLTRLRCPWNSPGKNIGVGCYYLLQEIFSTQGSNLALPHCRQILYHLSHKGSPQHQSLQ